MKELKDSKVFKIGGGCLKDPVSVKKIVPFLEKNIDFLNEEKVIFVLSAFNGVTRQLGKIANISNKESKLKLLKNLEEYYQKFVRNLFDQEKNKSILELTLTEINNIFVEIRGFINYPSENKKFIYDQIVSQGEIISSMIVNYFLFSQDKFSRKSEIIDATSLIYTDNNYTKAKINFVLSDKMIKNHFESNFSYFPILITQGFIAHTYDVVDKRGKIKTNTTMGKESSDYSAIVIAKALEIKEVTLFKDVLGVFPRNPKRFDYQQSEVIPHLSYGEFFNLVNLEFKQNGGSMLVHSKAITLAEKSKIVLKIKSFFEPEKEGTIIS